ncbi:MAG: Crp/Fnr family transcriptional regulator [Chitinophagales bacterium]
MADGIFFKDPQLKAEFLKYAKSKHFVRDEVMMVPGNTIVYVPIVVKGSIRILREDEEAREIFLYHIYPGQTCAMSLSCCQSSKTSMIKAVAEDDTEVYMIPVELLDDWFRFKEWRAFINSTYSYRFVELMQVIDLIAFNNMDKQLLNYLEKRAEAIHTKALFVTHQQIADELHTHREAVSRLLRTMEDKGLVKLGRNTIELMK